MTATTPTPASVTGRAQHGEASPARQYLEVLFEDVRGCIDLRLIAPDGVCERIPCASISDTLERVNAAATRTQNVYVGIASRRTMAREEGAGGKHNLAASRALWVDCDFKHDGDRERFEELLRTFPMPASMIVFSGGGMHAYWLLDEPVDLTTEADVLRFEHTLKGLCDYLSADRSATDASRILRIPGTINYPDAKKRAEGRVPTPCETLSAAGHLYTFSDFEEFEMRGEALAGNSERVTYNARPFDGTLPRRMELLLLDRRIRARFERDAAGLADQSPSAIDFSLASILAHRGCTGAEIEAAVRVSRAQDTSARPKGDHYFTRTVEKALSASRLEAVDDEREVPAVEGDLCLEDLVVSDEHPDGNGAARAVLADLRPEIILSGSQLDDTADEAVAAVRSANAPPHLFVRSGQLVRIRRDEAERPMVDGLGSVDLLDLMAAAARWRKRVKTETGFQLAAAHPTRGLADVVLARIKRTPDALPPLVSVVESPVFRADGTIVARRGYEPITRTFYAPATSFELAAIPERPTPGELAGAVQGVAELLQDFAFATEADRATAWAALLSATLRFLIDGCVPLTLIDAPTQGTGKSLLANLIATVASGRAGGMMPAPGDRDDAEWRKRITAVLSAGHALAVIDNVEHPLGSPSLASVLTAASWQDRALGRSEMLTLPASTIWIVTGNNLRLRGDLPRRSVWCRMDAKSARPWAREGFKHPDLLAWVREFRGEILAAVFTMARAWIAAGRPAPEASVPVIGSFEEWRHVVGGILRVAEVPGFLENLESLYDRADEETPAWASFLCTWWQTWGDAPKTSREILDAVTSQTPGVRISDLAEALPDDLEPTAKQPLSAKRLGRALLRKQDQRFAIDDLGATVALTQGARDRHAKVIRWRVIGC